MNYYCNKKRKEKMKKIKKIKYNYIYKNNKQD